MPVPDKKTIKINSLAGLIDTRAAVVPSSFNEKDNTIELIWSTGAKVTRTQWDGSKFIEELSMDPAAIRMERMNSGAVALINSHSPYDVRQIFGAVIEARVSGGQGTAKVKLSARADAAGVVTDLKDGVIRNVSVGYKVHKYQDVTADPEDKVKTYRAIDWEPMEISLVAIPADFASQTRADESSKEMEVEIETRTENETEIQTEIKTNSKETTVPQTDETEKKRQEEIEAAKKKASDDARISEQTRISDINLACRSGGFSEDEAQRFIRDNISADEVRKAVVNKLADDSQKNRTVSQVTITREHEPKELMARGMETALLHRSDPKQFQMDDVGRHYAHMSLVRMAEEALLVHGKQVRGNADEIVKRAMHTVSDFPALLGNVANKHLLKGYKEQGRNWEQLVNIIEVADFKQITGVNLGEASDLEEVNDSGIIKKGTISEEQEKYNVKSYAKIIPISRKAIINDDMKAFTTVPLKMGQAGGRLENDLFWGIFLANAAMGDNVALFHASHNNLTASQTGLTNAGIGIGMAALRKQVGINKKSLDLEAKFILVPSELESVARGLLFNGIAASSAANANIYAGMLTPIYTSKLTAGSYYLMADPGIVDTIEVAYLQGQRGMFMESDTEFNTDGVSFKARLDVGMKAMSFRGMVKTPYS